MQADDDGMKSHARRGWCLQRVVNAQTLAHLFGRYTAIRPPKNREIQRPMDVWGQASL